MLLIFQVIFGTEGRIINLKIVLNFRRKSIKKVIIPSALVVICWLLTTGYVYYNTQILNPYKKSKELEKIAVEYENKYKNINHYPCRRS